MNRNDKQMLCLLGVIINPLPSALIDLSPATLTILFFCDVRLNVKLTKSMHVTCHYVSNFKLLGRYNEIMACRGIVKM